MKFFKGVLIIVSMLLILTGCSDNNMELKSKSYVLKPNEVRIQPISNMSELEIEVDKMLPFNCYLGDHLIIDESEVDPYYTIYSGYVYDSENDHINNIFVYTDNDQQLSKIYIKGTGWIYTREEN